LIAQDPVPLQSATRTLSPVAQMKNRGNPMRK
jgi:hypothetical protein